MEENDEADKPPSLEDDTGEDDNTSSSLFAEEIGLGIPIDVAGQDFEKTEAQIKDLKDAQYDPSLAHFRECQEHKFPADEIQDLLPAVWNGACEVAQAY